VVLDGEGAGVQALLVEMLAHGHDLVLQLDRGLGGPAMLVAPSIGRLRRRRGTGSNCLSPPRRRPLCAAGGRLGLIWNAGCQPDHLADALEEVYASVVPRAGHSLLRGYAYHRSSDVKTGLGSEIEAVSAVPDFGAPTEITVGRALPQSGTDRR